MTDTLPTIQTDNPPAANADNPMGLLAMVMQDPNADPDKLAKAMDLYERWEAKGALAAYNVAMQSAQADMPCVVKDKRNTHTNSDYASIETVQHAVKPIYTRHGLSVSFDEVPCERDGWVRVRALVQHRDGHREEFFREGPMDNKGAKGNATKSELHGVTSTMTYLSRHLLCGIFSIVVAGTDLDGNTPSDTITSEQAQKVEAAVEALEDRTPGSKAKFLAWLTVEDCTQIPAARYSEVMDALTRRMREDNK